jgi:hypothetical protein
MDMAQWPCRSARTWRWMEVELSWGPVPFSEALRAAGAAAADAPLL